MNIKVDFDNIVVKEDKNDFNVKVLMLKGEKGDGGGEDNVIEKVQVNGTDLPVTNKTVNVSVPIVDSALSLSSTNPVQNKVIYNALNTKVNTSTLNNYYETSEVDNLLSNKADASTVNTNIANETTARTNADTNLQNQITSLASGSPLVASSTSGMTDTTKVYVNTTDGHWYYYDGTNWEDGGVYQSSQSSSELNEINTNIKFNRDFINSENSYQKLVLNENDFEVGAINSSNGQNVAYNQTIRTKNFMVFDEMIDLLKNNVTTNTYCELHVYNNDGTYFKRELLNSFTKYPFITSNRKYRLQLGIGSVVSDISSVISAFNFEIRGYLKHENPLFKYELANLVNPDDIMVGYIVTTGGNFYNTGDATYCSTVVRIDASKTYYSDRPDFYSAFYDENFDLISSHGSGGYTNPALTNPITPPSNAVYFAQTKLTSSIGSAGYISTVNSYYNYGIYFNNVKDDIVQNDKPLLRKDVSNLSVLKNKKILFIGDSITSTDYTTPNYWQIIAINTEAICEADAVSGTSLAHSNLRHLYGGLDAETIGYIPDNPETWYTGNCICERIGRITSGDYDAIVIMGGTNDLYCGKGTWDSTDIHTLYGAMNYIFNELCNNFPSKKIIMCTPIQKATSYTSNVYDPLTSLTNLTNTADLPLQLLCEAIKQKCHQYSIPCVDLFNDSGVNGTDANKIYYRSNDILHPSSYGEERIASLIQAKLEELFKE